MSWFRAGLLVVVIVMTAACAGEAPVPSRTGPGQTPSKPPTGKPDGEERFFSYTSGRAVVRISADAKPVDTISVPLERASYTPGDEMELHWSGGGFEYLKVDGPSFRGTREVHLFPRLSLAFSQRGTAAFFNSFQNPAGTCTLTLESAGEDELRGTVRCNRAQTDPSLGPAVTFDASGTFTATR